MDWATHFKKISQSPFGTVGGQQTVAELKDLVASTNYRMAQLGQAISDNGHIYAQNDAAGWADFMNDWNNLQNRVNAALSSANTIIDTSALDILTPDSLLPAQPQYDALLKSLKASAPPDGGPITKGDFDDLNDRFTAATSITPDYSQMPQPVAVDADLQVLNNLPKVPNPVPSTWPSWVIPVLVFLVLACFLRLFRV